MYKTLVVIGTDCTGSSKSNYNTITTTTAPIYKHSHHTCITGPVFTVYLRKDSMICLLQAAILSKKNTLVLLTD